MEVVDLQECELAKVHGRHLVGGRSEAARNEVLCRFEYPERPGSLKSFLNCLPDEWNVSLFHYRNHGADVGRILAGKNDLIEVLLKLFNHCKLNCFFDRFASSARTPFRFY